MDPELVQAQDASLVRDDSALDAELQEQFLSLVAEKLAATEVIVRELLASDVPFINQANFYIDRRFAWQMPNTEDDPGGNPNQSNRSLTVVF